jgi:hypothetical protein
VRPMSPPTVPLSFSQQVFVWEQPGGWSWVPSWHPTPSTPQGVSGRPWTDASGFWGPLTHFFLHCQNFPHSGPHSLGILLHPHPTVHVNTAISPCFPAPHMFRGQSEDWVVLLQMPSELLSGSRCGSCLELTVEGGRRSQYSQTFWGGEAALVFELRALCLL